MKIKRLYNAEDFTIGQLYMYVRFDKLYRGFCVKITPEDVYFKDLNGNNETRMAYKEYWREIKQNYFAEYNSNIFNKYEKLTEYCLSIDADVDTVLKVLTFLRDTAGQKPKEDVAVVNMPIINIKGL